MTSSPSFPPDRWRGPTIKQEQKSLSQPKPCSVVLIVCSGAVGIAYLIAAITNCLYRDRRDLLWMFREWFVLRRFLRERTMGRDRVEEWGEETVHRERADWTLSTGESLFQQEMLKHLANAFMAHNLQQACYCVWLALSMWHPTEVCAYGPDLLCVCVCQTAHSFKALINGLSTAMPLYQ